MDPVHSNTAMYSTTVLATVALVLRIVARRMTKGGYGYEDALAVVAYISGVANSGVVLLWINRYCLGQDMKDGPQDLDRDTILENSYILLWWTALLYVISIAFSQYTVLAFYWRLFKFSNIRIPIQICIGLTIIWFISQVLMCVLQCSPPKAFWDLQNRDSQCHISEATFFFGQVLTHVLLDFSILILPIIQIARVNLRLPQKLGVIGLFTFGIITCCVAILVLTECLKYHPTTEMPRDSGKLIVLSGVEVNMAVIAGSLLLLRPVIVKLLPSSIVSLTGVRTQSASQHPSTALKLRATPKSANADESSLVNQVADLEIGQEFDMGYDGNRYGPKTQISGPWTRNNSSEDWDYGDSIHVRSETVMSVRNV